mmetsp:Transcript_34944/g.85466  ORF Transcript_34944/g.85466 Transcript_34944/m.85466 type:complete len:210 (-) Transcript_34944:136-765(-)
MLLNRAADALVVHVVSALLAATMAYCVFDNSYFSYHPALLTLAYVFCSANAVTFMRSQRLHYVHMSLNAAALVLSAGGLYVIHTLKNTNGKPHWWTMSATWHAWYGGVGFWLFAAQAAYSLVRLAPWVDARMRRREAPLHRAFAVLTFSLAMLAVITGWNKFYPYNESPVAFYAYTIGCAALWLFLGLPQRAAALASGSSGGGIASARR